MMRCEEPGFEAIAIPDGRRGLWRRTTWIDGAAVRVEIGAGREADDHFVAFGVGEAVDVRMLAELHDVLDCLRYAQELASESYRNRVGGAERDSARASGAGAVVDALEIAERELVALHSEMVRMEGELRAADARRKLFFISVPGWRDSFAVVRADDENRASKFARESKEDLPALYEVMEISAEGPEGVLWSHSHSPGSRRGS